MYGVCYKKLLAALLSFLVSSGGITSARFFSGFRGSEQAQDSSTSNEVGGSIFGGLFGERDSASRDTAPRYAAPRDPAPRYTAPRDTAPRDPAPRYSAPRDSAPRYAPPPVEKARAPPAEERPDRRYDSGGSSSKLNSLFSNLVGGGRGRGQEPAPGSAPPRYDPGSRQRAAAPAGYSSGNVALLYDAIKAAIITAIEQQKKHKYYAYRLGDGTRRPHKLALSLQMAGDFGVDVYKISCELFKICDKTLIKQIMKDIYLPDELRCPQPEEEMECPADALYRTYDGSCNNLQHPAWGKSFTGLQRLMENDYYDGVSSPRRAKDGSQLPNARFVCVSLTTTNSDPQKEVNNLLVSWGQFTDHDVGLTPNVGEDTDMVPECCDQSSTESLHKACLQVPIRDDDPHYGPIGQKCMQFVRSIAAPDGGCTPGPREQLNQITAWLDASNVYGSTEEDAVELRALNSGQMKVTEHLFDSRLKPLLPVSEECCEACRCQPELNDFKAGDVRNSETHMLTSMHTMFVRYHNYICGELQALNPQWDDERLYQTAKRILGAIIQVITYKEFLPVFIGSQAMSQYTLNMLPQGYSTYDERTHPGLFNEFSTVAYRVGHTMVTEEFKRETVSGNSNSIPLGDTFFQPENLHYPSSQALPFGIDPIMKGLLIQNAEKFDTNIVGDLRNALFKEKCSDASCAHSGSDLCTRNVQRARDHGIPGYTKFLETCFGLRINSWSDLRDAGYLDTNFINKLTLLYTNVHDIDPFPAIIAEKPVFDGVVGKTAGCIIGQQFQGLKYGDKYYFEHGNVPNKFREDQLQNFRQMSLASIICETLDSISEIQVKDIFAIWNPISNPHQSCSTVPKIDFSKY